MDYPGSLPNGPRCPATPISYYQEHARLLPLPCFISQSNLTRRKTEYHEIIKPKLQRFASWLSAYGRDEVGNVETRLFVDTGRMVDRAVAQRAGLGWYGKNTTILTKRWGFWVFLAEFVTILP